MTHGAPHLIHWGELEVTHPTGEDKGPARLSDLLKFSREWPDEDSNSLFLTDLESSVPFTIPIPHELIEVKSWGRTNGLQNYCGNEWHGTLSHAKCCLLGLMGGDEEKQVAVALIPKQLSRRNKFWFPFFSFCFALKEERESHDVLNLGHFVLLNLTSSRVETITTECLTPWTKTNDAVQFYAQQLLWGLTDITYQLYSEHHQFMHMQALKLWSPCLLQSGHSFVCKIQLSTGLMLSYTLHCKEMDT